MMVLTPKWTVLSQFQPPDMTKSTSSLHCRYPALVFCLHLDDVAACETAVGIGVADGVDRKDRRGVIQRLKDFDMAKMARIVDGFERSDVACVFLGASIIIGAPLVFVHRVAVDVGAVAVVEGGAVRSERVGFGVAAVVGERFQVGVEGGLLGAGKVGFRFAGHDARVGPADQVVSVGDQTAGEIGSDNGKYPGSRKVLVIGENRVFQIDPGVVLANASAVSLGFGVVGVRLVLRDRDEIQIDPRAFRAGTVVEGPARSIGHVSAECGVPDGQVPFRTDVHRPAMDMGLIFMKQAFIDLSSAGGVADRAAVGCAVGHERRVYDCNGRVVEAFGVVDGPALAVVGVGVVGVEEADCNRQRTVVVNGPSSAIGVVGRKVRFYVVFHELGVSGYFHSPLVV